MRQPILRGLRMVDLFDEALAGIVQRPGRAGLSLLGVAIAVAAFVAVLGLTSTASNQISSRFTVLSATEVMITDSGEAATEGTGFNDGAEDRVRSLRGVQRAGVFWRSPVGDAAVSATNTTKPGESLAVLAASPDLLRAVHARASQGVLYDEFHDRRHERVAVLGAAAAHRLGIARPDTQPAVFVNGTPLTVVGIVGEVDRQPGLLLSVIVPARTAAALWGPPASGEGAQMLVETDLGAAQVVARQVAVAARPDAPARLKVTAPPDPHALRDSVVTDLNALYIALACIALIIGAVGIANTMLVSVLERISEIGLRRALGAHRRHVIVQFVTESSALGLLGGLLGTSVGIAVVVIVAVVQRWTPVMEPWTAFPAPLVGALTGLAGLYPAYRASRVEPADALQR